MSTKDRAKISKDWRERNRSLGICVGCTNKAPEGFALCQACRDTRAEFQKDRTDKGLCFRCSNVAAPGRKKCLDCVLKVAIYDLRRKGLPETELRKAELAFAEYQGICSCCQLPIISGKERFDHDDENKIFRGIICHSCNVAIGFAEENILRLKGCILYLEKQR